MIIQLKNLREIGCFVDSLAGCDDCFLVMSYRNPVKTFNAHSVIAIAVLAFEEDGEMLLINSTREGYYPEFVQKYAVG